MPFHGENRGSIPLGRAKDFNSMHYKPARMGVRFA